MPNPISHYPILIGEAQEDGSFSVPPDTLRHCKLLAATRAAKHNKTFVKTNGLVTNLIEFFNSLSSLFRSLQDTIVHLLFKKSEQDPLPCLITTDGSITTESDVLFAAYLETKTGIPSTVTVDEVDETSDKMPPQERLTKKTFITAQLTLFFQALDLQPEDDGIVAQSLKAALTSRLETLWRRCRPSLDDTTYEDVVRSLHLFREDFSSDLRILRITDLLKTSFDHLTRENDSRDIQRLQQDIQEVCNELTHKYLNSSQ